MAEVLERTRSRKDVRHPSKVDVIVLNNNVTPFPIVILTLMSVFKKDKTDAINIAAEADRNGSSVVVKGISKEIAMTLVECAMSMARSMGDTALSFEIKPTK